MRYFLLVALTVASIIMLDRMNLGRFGDWRLSWPLLVIVVTFLGTLLYNPRLNHSLIGAVSVCLVASLLAWIGTSHLESNWPREPVTHKRDIEIDMLVIVIGLSLLFGTLLAWLRSKLVAT